MKGIGVTINIPTYNQENLIQRAITSALQQEWPGLEVNVLDDASTDDTFNKIKLIDSQKIHVYRNEHNLGRVKTYRKLLFDLTFTDWVVNLDGDDCFTSTAFIAEGMKWIGKYPAGSIAFFQANHLNLASVSKLKTAVRLDEQTYIVDGDDYLKNYHKIKSFDHFATLYNRKFAVESDAYGFDSLNTDFNSVMKLCVHGKVILSSLKIGEWNYNLQSETNRIFEKDNFKAYLTAIEDLADYSRKRLSAREADVVKRNLLRLLKSYLFMIAIKKKELKTAGSILARNINFSADYLRNLLKFVRVSLLSIFNKK